MKQLEWYVDEWHVRTAWRKQRGEHRTDMWVTATHVHGHQPSLWLHVLIGKVRQQQNVLCGELWWSVKMLMHVTGWVMSSTPTLMCTRITGRGLGDSAGHGLVARLTGWWGLSRTWSCTGQWVGGCSSSHHQLPPPSFLLLGFPDPHYHLQA